MSQRKIVVFNANDESMVGDVISATRSVFASAQKKQPRKVLDYPDDVGIDSVDESPRLLEGEDDESVAEEDLSSLKKSNSTLDAIFKRLQQTKKKKVTIRAKRALIVPRITRFLPKRKQPPVVPDDGSLTWDEDEPHLEPTANQAEDFDAILDEYDDLDRPKPQPDFVQEHLSKKKKSVRLIYVEDQIKKHPDITRSLAGYLLPRANRSRASRSLSSTMIRKRIHVPITNRITFVNNGANHSASNHKMPMQKFSDGRFSGARNRTIGGRIRRKEWPSNLSGWDKEPTKAWAIEKLPQRTDQGDRFQPWLKCVCISNNDSKHKHKGRGFTMSGRLHAYD